MTRYLFLTALFFVICIPVFAEGVSTAPKQSQVVSRSVSYQECTKIFNVNKEKLFYLTIGAVNANRFKTDEIQTENGYVIFSVNKNKYTATIAGVDKENSILKITPYNNVYYFQPEIISNIYKYIEINKDSELK